MSFLFGFLNVLEAFEYALHLEVLQSCRMLFCYLFFTTSSVFQSIVHGFFKNNMALSIPITVNWNSI